MPALDLSRAAWRKSTRSQAQGACIEVAFLGNAVAVRDSKNPTGPTLAFTPIAWATFVRSTTDGDFPLR